ncbi:MAG: DNA recombination protein RmuC [Planctomycetota bacterium]
MEIALIVVSALLAGALCVVAWLLRGRVREAGELAGARSERDGLRERAERAEASLRERDAEIDAAQERLGSASERAVRLAEQLASERRSHEQAQAEMRQRLEERAEHERRTLEQLDARYKEAFENLASKTLERSADRFLKQASEAFASHREKADATFDEKRRAFAELVSPITDALSKTDERLTKLDEQRLQSAAALKQHLELLSRQTAGLGDQTEKLVRSLKGGSQVRGRWGELQLRRVVELAGMSAHCDFDEQAKVAGDEEGGRKRPDMVVRLPGERCIVVDAKAPLKNYLEAIEAESDKERAERLTAHARNVRERVDELASKAYQHRLGDEELSPDFSVLFVPGDQFLSAALLETPDLLEHAASRGVILTTPATLIALLKAVSFGWAQATLEEDAREILKLGTELHDRVRTLTEHLGKLGLNLTRSVKAFNDTVGSLESRVLPSARRIGEMGAVQTKKQIERQEQVLTEPKRLAPPEDPGADTGSQGLLIGGDGASPDGGGSS